MKRVLFLSVMILLLICGHNSNAWISNGWIYTQWPYCYSVEDQAVYYFDEQGTQYCYSHCTGKSNNVFGNGCMGTGLVYILWPYAYGVNERCLYSFSEPGQLNCQNQTTGALRTFLAKEILMNLSWRVNTRGID